MPKEAKRWQRPLEQCFPIRFTLKYKQLIPKTVVKNDIVTRLVFYVYGMMIACYRG